MLPSWCLTVLVQVQVVVLDFSGPTSLQFGLGTFLDQTQSMCSICSVVFCSFDINHTSHQPQKVTDVTASIGRISYILEW